MADNRQESAQTRTYTPDYADTGEPLTDLIDALPRMAEVRRCLTMLAEPNLEGLPPAGVAMARKARDRWAVEWQHWYFRIPDLSLKAMPMVASYEKGTDLHVAVRDFAHKGCDDYEADFARAKELATRLEVVEAVVLPEVSALRVKRDTDYLGAVMANPLAAFRDLYPAFRDEVRRVRGLTPPTSSVPAPETKPEAPKLKPAHAKAGEAMARLAAERDDLSPADGEAVSAEAWEWIEEHGYDDRRDCPPSLDTFQRYVREFNRAANANPPASKVPGVSGMPTRSVVRKCDIEDRRTSSKD